MVSLASLSNTFVLAETTPRRAAPSAPQARMSALRIPQASLYIVPSFLDRLIDSDMPFEQGTALHLPRHLSSCELAANWTVDSRIHAPLKQTETDREAREEKF